MDWSEHKLKNNAKINAGHRVVDSDASWFKNPKYLPILMRSQNVSWHSLDRVE